MNTAATAEAARATVQVWTLQFLPDGKVLIADKAVAR